MTMENLMQDKRQVDSNLKSGSAKLSNTKKLLYAPRNFCMLQKQGI